MSDKKNQDKSNDFEKQLKEVDEWEKNSNNPGHYVGSGKVPAPMKNLFRSPIIMLVVGIIFLIPTIYNLVKNFSIYSISSNAMPFIIGIVLFVGGIARLFMHRN